MMLRLPSSCMTTKTPILATQKRDSLLGCRTCRRLLPNLNPHTSSAVRSPAPGRARHTRFPRKSLVVFTYLQRWFIIFMCTSPRLIWTLQSSERVAEMSGRVHCSIHRIIPHFSRKPLPLGLSFGSHLAQSSTLTFPPGLGVQTGAQSSKPSVAIIRAMYARCVKTRCPSLVRSSVMPKYTLSSGDDENSYWVLIWSSNHFRSARPSAVFALTMARSSTNSKTRSTAFPFRLMNRHGSAALALKPHLVKLFLNFLCHTAALSFMPYSAFLRSHTSPFFGTGTPFGTDMNFLTWLSAFR